MNAEQVIGFVLALVVMLVGLAGSVLPGIPGAPLVFLAALGHKLWFGAASPAWWIVAVMGLLVLFSLGVDFLATTLGAKKLGATWRGMVGAGVGAIIGLFIGPLGLVVGTILGAALAEMLGGREWREAGRAGVGAALGLLAGTVGKVACCVAMIGLFVFSLLLGVTRA